MDVSYQIRFGSFNVSVSDAQSREHVSRSLCGSRRHSESLSQPGLHPWRAARGLIRPRPASAVAYADVLRQTMLLPTVGNSDIPATRCASGQRERPVLASDPAEAYIGLSSFRTALRKRVHAAQRRA